MDESPMNRDSKRVGGEPSSGSLPVGEGSRNAQPRRRWRDNQTIRATRARARRASDTIPQLNILGLREAVSMGPRDVARSVLVVVGILLGIYALWYLAGVLLLVFLAILMATAIEPLVTKMRRGPFSRGSGALTVYATIVGVFALIAYITVPGLIAEGFAFVDGLPNRLETFRPAIETLEPVAVRDFAISSLDRALAFLRTSSTNSGEQFLSVGTSALSAIVSVITVFVLAYYWLMERNSIKRVMLKLAGTERAREVNTIWLEVEEKWGGWVRGQALLMLSIGTMAGIGYVVMGLPNPLLLAGWAAATEIVPLIGPFLGFAPAILVAFTISPQTALVLIVYAVIIQQIEGYVLFPRIMSHAVGVSSLTVTLGILTGATIDGIIGAFLAVPVAAAIQVMLTRIISNESSTPAADYVRLGGRMIPPTDILNTPYSSVGGPGLVMLSDLRRFDVSDGRGLHAKLSDLSFELKPGEDPRIVTMIFQLPGKGPIELPWEALLSVDWAKRVMTVGDFAASRAAPPAAILDFLLLERDLVGARIVDLRKQQVRKATDVFLREENGHLRISAVDVSRWALIRKFGRFAIGKKGFHQLVNWRDVEFLRGKPDAVAMGRDYNRHISRLTAPEIVAISSALPVEYMAEALALLPSKLAVDALEMMPIEHKVQVSTALEEDQIISLFEIMHPQSVAAILDQLSPELAARCREKLLEAARDHKVEVRG